MARSIVDAPHPGYSGIDPVTLAALPGHFRIEMVLRYAHPIERHQAEAAKRLEEFNAARLTAIEQRQAAAIIT